LPDIDKRNGHYYRRQNDRNLDNSYLKAINTH